VRDRLVVQWGGDRASIARRIRLGRRLREVAPGLPLAEVVAGQADARPPFVVSRFVEGTPGRDLLASDDDARRLGAAVGALLHRLQAVPTTGLRLSTTWADAARLAPAAQGWLDRGRPALEPSDVRSLERLLAGIPELLRDEPPVFAHGDLAPVNVVLDGDVVVGLLDLERARLAQPVFDAAWWLWIIGHHHPERLAAAGGAFHSAAGIDPADPQTRQRLRAIAALQCLEMLAHTQASGPASAPAAGHRATWASRVGEALRALGEPA
jgi:Ser/Thr protein kinase RdoA (MazF antagonist)